LFVIKKIDFMQKKNLKTFGLTVIAFALTLFAAQASDALSVYLASGTSAEKMELDNIQRVTFSETGNLLVKPFNGNAIVYILENIGKITFEDMMSVGIANVPMSDLKLYVTRDGEVVVESTADIQSLTLFSVVGHLLARTTSSRMQIGYLPQNVYLLKIDTSEGTVVKRIIKQ